MAAPATLTPTNPVVRVMVVDDSAVVRGFVVRMLESDSRIAVVATCSNGAMAVQQASRWHPDVIVLDIEMPVMDGITAVPKLLEVCPHTKIIMASTLTQKNAAVSLEALSRGAADYIPKPTSNRLASNDDFRRDLIEKVVALGSSPGGRPATAPASGFPLVRTPPSGPRKAPSIALRALTRRRPKIIAIGSSTGGPQALQALLAKLPAVVDCPIVIAQHMPKTFTTVLAQHIARCGTRPCVEAVDGAEIMPGTITLAPGDYHLQVQRTVGACIAHLSQSPPENFCRPSVDPLFRSVAAAFGAEACAVVLTGMGSDGCAGARVIAQAGAPVIAQDEATSVVWGMPGAVATAGLCTAVLPLPRIVDHLVSLFSETVR